MENPNHMLAEHESLATYLKSVLTPEQRERVLLISFSHWDFTTAAVAETAATLHAMGDNPVLALWAGRTPIKDVGWTTMPGLARLLGSRSRDDRVREGLKAFGVPEVSFLKPPIRRWRPQGCIRIPHLLNRSAIRTMEYRGSELGRGILQVTPNRQTPVTDDYLWPRRWVQATARSYAWAYDQAHELMRRQDVTAVVVYNGRFLHDSAAAAAAEDLGLPVLAYDMGGNDTDFDLTIDATHDWSALQRRMLHLYEQWPSAERDSLGSSWFLERTQHVDPRNTPYVESQERGVGIERPAKSTLVVFFSSSGDEISELDLDWGDYFHGQPQALKALADVCRQRPDCFLVVRSHPHKRMKPPRDVEDWLAAVDEADPDLHLDPNSPVDSYALMQQADLIVTYGSTTGVEAAFAGKAVIVMGPSAYDELGCVTRVRSSVELARAVDERRVGAWSGAVAYGLMMRRRGFIHSHIRRDEDGYLDLSGVRLSDPPKPIMDLSHLRGRAQKRWLTRHDRRVSPLHSATVVQEPE